jgi:molybdopterin converting factor small subunit
MTNKITVMNQTATLQIPNSITKGEALKIDVKVDDKSTIQSVLQQVEDKELLAKLFDERGNPSNYLTVMLNGKNIAFRDGMETVVKGSDQVYVIPVVSGGSI